MNFPQTPDDVAILMESDAQTVAEGFKDKLAAGVLGAASLLGTAGCDDRAPAQGASQVTSRGIESTGNFRFDKTKTKACLIIPTAQASDLQATTRQAAETLAKLTGKQWVYTGQHDMGDTVLLNFAARR